MKGNTADDEAIALRTLVTTPSSALFVGPRGSGKRRAAEEVAHSLAVNLRRVDLAQLVGRHIGETEKNIDRLFDDASRDGAVLFFDEVEALFAKRGQVRDAHDRYANIEVNYLLAKAQSHTGVTIITASSREAVDPTVVARLGTLIAFQPSAQSGT
jgi:SpoVK/Ycf46/Vps4 family AAA+-type ATPase